ncbi:MAG TPA: 2-C-methyl-D-erythritol 2,4-cyclodiphosphate synthase, partial [Chloroflexota bacterium]
GEPLIARPLRVLAQCATVDDLIVVVAAEAQARAQALLDSLSIAGTVVPGGARRQDSVRAGLNAADQADWVVVHDAARPLLTEDLIIRGLEAAQASGAAIAAVPEINTVKLVEDGSIRDTLDRTHLWLAQTPQVFRRSLLIEAHERFPGDATDDAMMVEALGIPVRVYEGAYANIKVTTSTDERLLTAYVGEYDFATSKHETVIGITRSGLGYDLHPLVKNRALILGGVEIPHERGLAGHSDGDVLTHAIADALIGAMGAGDLGQWFPDTNATYEGAQSLGLLRQVASKLSQDGWHIGNVDASIVAQRPRLAPHLAAMRNNLAKALEVGPELVNVKATSPEGVGSLGGEEAISAFATALIERRP